MPRRKKTDDTAQQARETVKRRGAGRPQYQPTPKDRAMVQSMTGYGIRQDDIAGILHIHPDTLRKHFHEEINRGVTLANTAVAQNLHSIAMGKGREAVTAAIFWLKCRAGWSETSPAPRSPQLAEPQLGKKEQAQLDAQTAEVGTKWSEFVH